MKDLHITFAKKYTDAVLLIFLIILAIIPRVISLDVIPFGLHGDEAITGLEAQKLLSEVRFEAYSGTALGQPIGPLYLTASIFKIFDPSIFTIRVSMAFYGILTVVLFYILMRYFFSKTVSFFTSLAFSFSLYHIHFSRIGFMLISAPVFEISSLICLLYSIKTRKWMYMLIAGITAGMGMYSYNTFILFPLSIMVFLLFAPQDKIKKRMQNLILFCSGWIFLSIPLLWTMLTKPEFYFQHHRAISLFSSPEFLEQKTALLKAIFLLKQIPSNYYHFFSGRLIDYVDGFGAFYSFDYFTLLLLFIGIGIAIYYRHVFGLFALFSILLTTISLVFTINGIYRRQILSLIYIYWFLGFTYSKIEQLKNQNLRHILELIMIFTIIIFAYINLQTYFVNFAQSHHSQSTFYNQLVQVSSILNTSSRSERILFYSNRWSCKYETLQFLLENQNCTDKSDEFSLPDEHIIELDTTTSIVLLGSYKNKITELKLLLPEHNVFPIYSDREKKETDGYVLIAE